MSDVFDVKWTGPAEAELSRMLDEPRFKGNVKEWHENIVRTYASSKVSEATTARIRWAFTPSRKESTYLLEAFVFRKPAHVGGTVMDEREHITVTFKRGNKSLGPAHHVYTTY